MDQNTNPQPTQPAGDQNPAADNGNPTPAAPAEGTEQAQPAQQPTDNGQAAA